VPGADRAGALMSVETEYAEGAEGRIQT
jgi:hypothetical protein